MRVLFWKERPQRDGEAAAASLRVGSGRHTSAELSRGQASSAPFIGCLRYWISRQDLKNADLRLMLRAFEAKHPKIAHHLCSDAGVRLMAIDGRITTRIIDHFTRKSLPILTVHDSYIVDIFHTNELRRVLKEAADSEVPGSSLSITQEGIGFDEMEAMVQQGVGYRPDC